MRRTRLFAVPAFLLLLTCPVVADDDGFVPMFDGKSLNGWVNVNCHPSTFYVENGEIITRGRPTGYLRTNKQYENFIAEFDWMHENKTKVGNSGFFVWCDPLPAVGTGYSRGIEVQVLVNLEYKNKKGEITATSHGDLFSIWGARCQPDRPHPDGWERCLPSENRAKGGGEWNHYKVTAYHGTLKLEVNGKLVSGVSQCTPRKGYLALESEGAVCHFRNLRIKELRSTNPKPEEIAHVDQGFRSMFNGLDLAGWEAEKGDWKPVDGVLKTSAKSPIKSENKFGKFELQFDWKVPAKSDDIFVVVAGGRRVSFKPDGKMVNCRIAGGTMVGMPRQGAWTRTKLSCDAKWLAVSVGTNQLRTPSTSSESAPIEIEPIAGLELRSIYIRELK